MNIATQFKPGEQVFFMKDNQISNAGIYSIDIRVTSKGTFINYYLSTDNFSKMLEGMFSEDRLFASKDVLRQSL